MASGSDRGGDAGLLPGPSRAVSSCTISRDIHFPGTWPVGSDGGSRHQASCDKLGLSPRAGPIPASFLLVTPINNYVI